MCKVSGLKRMPLAARKAKGIAPGTGYQTHKRAAGMNVCSLPGPCENFPIAVLAGHISRDLFGSFYAISCDGSVFALLTLSMAKR
jgi:hypothetical protein